MLCYYLKPVKNVVLLFKTGKKCCVIIVTKHLFFQLKAYVLHFCRWFHSRPSSTWVRRLRRRRLEDSFLSNKAGENFLTISVFETISVSLFLLVRTFWPSLFLTDLICCRCALLGREMAPRRRSWWFWTLTPKPSDQDSFRTRPIKPISLLKGERIFTPLQEIFLVWNGLFGSQRL